MEHRINKNNIQDVHYDLLLEDGSCCKSWRLDKIPVLDGPAVEAIVTEPHKLHWLDKKEAFVSGGRGWVKRVLEGFFNGVLPLLKNDPIQIEIYGKGMEGYLEIKDYLCSIRSCSFSD